MKNKKVFFLDDEGEVVQGKIIREIDDSYEIMDIQTFVHIVIKGNVYDSIDELNK